MKTTLCSLAAFALLLTTASARAGDFFFHDGDRPIVFLGDSITQQRMYTTYIETYILSRYPQWNVTFRNIGWDSDTSWLSRRDSFDTGMKRDVLSLKPSAITIDFGMNDARGGDAAYPRFVEHSTKLAEQLKAAGARVALVTPSPEERFEPNQPAGSAYNNMLWKYSQALQTIAATQGVTFVDQYPPFISTIASGRSTGILTSNGSVRLIHDTVHPNWAGHLVMAAAILKGLGASALVSRAELNAATGELLVAEKCRVDNIQAKDGILTFRRTDDCLPWFVPEDARFALKIPGFTPLGDLSRYELRVTHLTAPQYKLTIDDTNACSFTKDELAAGVNLSLCAGPITTQAKQLHNAVVAKNDTFFVRWRKIQLFATPAWLQTPGTEAARQQECARVDAEIEDQEKTINHLRLPVPHVFSLTPVQ